jgi:TusE/DsrC/DsvC family sulfur relay protein
MHPTQTQYASIRRQLPFRFDDDGFLVDPAGWTQQAAQMIADMDGIGALGPDHWSVIYYLREHHLTYGSIPPMPQVCRATHLANHAVDWLFGGCREAWRVAGLPSPGEEALSYMR